MIRIIENLRIGIKLAVASALGIALVGFLIFSQVTGGASVRRSFEYAVEQQSIAGNASEAKASVRGMQLGIRDLLLAGTPAEMQKAVGYFAERQAAANKFIDNMAKLSRSAENRQRIARLGSLVTDYSEGGDQIAAVQAELINLGARRGPLANRLLTPNGLPN